MSHPVNGLGQPVGEPVPEWVARSRPLRQAMEGRFCRVEPLDMERHADQLYAGITEDVEGRTWTYLFYGPFQRREDFRAWLSAAVDSEDPLFYAVVDRESGIALGVLSYLRIEAGAGAIAVGHIIFAPSLRRTPAATEGMALMLGNAFDTLGYRRCEWRCDTLNTSSRHAAERFGFHLEGIFRQAAVNKGRNRDTACYSIIDGEWPHIRASFEHWLRPENFDADGGQRERLSVMTASR